MTKPSRKDFERVAASIERDDGPYWESDKDIILAALRIAAEQVVEREKVVTWHRERGARARKNFDDRTYIFHDMCADYIEAGDHSTATLVSGWRSMDSAPRDGTRVLLWYEELEPHTIQGQWDADFGWVDVWNNDKIEGDSGSIWPTHWQPLPSPPGGGT